MLYSFDGKIPVIGKDTYVSETAIVVGNVVIGDNCYIGHGAIIRGDYGRIEIGSGTAVEEGAILHAPPENTNSIGEKVTIGHGAVVHGRRLDDYVVIGMKAVVSIWAYVGEKSIIAEGSVVKLNGEIPSGVVAAGIPAKIIREITEKDINFWSVGKQVYIDLAKKYLDVGMHKLE